MSSSTVKAQRLANQANIQMNDANNLLQRDLADAANDLNYKMFQEQNDWNLLRRDEEWDYNSPSSQMQRYIEAGINPLWAMSKGDAGTAQQLTSASPAPAEYAKTNPSQVMPEADPSRLNNIVGAANNVTNSLQGFMKLGLESMDVQTRKSSAASQIALNRADIAFKKAQTHGQEIYNNLNTDTYQTLVSTKVRELDELEVRIANGKKQGELFEAETANAKETKNQIMAMTDYTKRQADAITTQLQQGWRRLAIDQQNANTNRVAVNSDVYYRGEQLKLSAKQFEFTKNKTASELQLQSNKQITDFILEQRGLWEKASGFSSNDGVNMNNEVLSKISAAGEVLYNRVMKDPSIDNVKSYQEYLNTINNLPEAPQPVVPANTSNTSILNPSESWQQ